MWRQRVSSLTICVVLYHMSDVSFTLFLACNRNDFMIGHILSRDKKAVYGKYLKNRVHFYFNEINIKTMFIC